MSIFKPSTWSLFNRNNGSYNSFFEGVTDLSSYLDINTKDDVLKAYTDTCTLNAIVNKSANLFSNVEIKHQNKAYENQQIIKHSLYSQSEFLLTYMKQITLFNDVFIYVNNILPKTYDKDTSFLILPSQNIEVVLKENINIKEINSTDNYIDYYKLSINGKKIVFEPYEILHITGTSLNIEDNNIVVPELTLRSAEQPINIIRSAYEARIGLNRKKGGTNILVNDQMNDGRRQPLKDPEINKLQVDLKKYSLNKNDYQTIITNASLKNINLNYPVKSLELNEGMIQANIDLCNVMNIPIEILNTLKGSTFDNKEQAEKQVYQSLQIPAWMRLEGELNNYFINTTENNKIIFDYSNIPALQEDKKTRIEGLNAETDVIIKLNSEIKAENITYDIALNILNKNYGYEVEEAKLYLNGK